MVSWGMVRICRRCAGSTWSRKLPQDGYVPASSHFLGWAEAGIAVTLIATKATNAAADSFDFNDIGTLQLFFSETRMARTGVRRCLSETRSKGSYVKVI